MFAIIEQVGGNGRISPSRLGLVVLMRLLYGVHPDTLASFPNDSEFLAVVGVGTTSVLPTTLDTQTLSRIASSSMRYLNNEAFKYFDNFHHMMESIGTFISRPTSMYIELSSGEYVSY